MTDAVKPEAISIVQVRWILRSRSRALPAAPQRAVTLLIEMEFIGNEAALVEARLETRGQPTRTVRRRSHLPCRSAVRQRMMHADVIGHDGRRLIALSLALEGGSARLLYAQTPLLREAGFAPGSFDGPTLGCTLPAKTPANQPVLADAAALSSLIP